MAGYSELSATLVSTDLSEEEKLEAAVVAFDGEALSW